MNGIFEMVGWLKPASKSSIDMGRVCFQFLQFVYMCDFSNGFFRPDFFALKRSRKNTGSETKAKENRGQKWITPKQKESFRKYYRIRWLGGSWFLFFSCLNLLLPFPFFFIIGFSVLNDFVWVNRSC